MNKDTNKRNYNIEDIKQYEMLANEKLSIFQAMTQPHRYNRILEARRVLPNQKLKSIYVIGNDFMDIYKTIEIFRLDKFTQEENIFLDENLSLIYDFKNENANSIKISAYNTVDNKPSKLSMKEHKLQKSLQK